MAYIDARTARTFRRRLFHGRGYLKTITLLKREDDQRQGVVKALTLFGCRRGKMLKTGEQIAGDETADHSCTWHIPRKELERVGLSYLNSTDRIVESTDDLGRPIPVPRFWQPESTTSIEIKLLESEIDVACLRVDP